MWTFNPTTSAIRSQMTGNICMSDGPGSLVWVYTNAASVELSLNGQSVGHSVVAPLGAVTFSVVYNPGRLIATVRFFVLVNIDL